MVWIDVKQKQTLIILHMEPGVCDDVCGGREANARAGC